MQSVSRRCRMKQLSDNFEHCSWTSLFIRFSFYSIILPELSQAADMCALSHPHRKQFTLLLAQIYWQPIIRNSPILTSNGLLMNEESAEGTKMQCCVPTLNVTKECSRTVSCVGHWGSNTERRFKCGRAGRIKFAVVWITALVTTNIKFTLVDYARWLKCELVSRRPRLDLFRFDLLTKLAFFRRFLFILTRNTLLFIHSLGWVWIDDLDDDLLSLTCHETYPPCWISNYQ